MNPFFVLCSYSCRRVYASVPPNSHVACFNRRGLAKRLARKSPVSTGALLAASLAIFRVYVSVTLSALPCACIPLSEESRITSFSSCIFTFNLMLFHTLETHIDYAVLYLFYQRQEPRNPRRQARCVQSFSLN